ncbi:hypothetical protein [Telmatocola sphagniphila]|uniref:hypothetical protein n=1 Tax=Telmatocola sphagniphila TaxID=1123043 RepID=UPI0036F3E73F
MSGYLNTLLKILNERTFDAGEGSLRKVPLKLCVAASNEWPAPESAQELAALFDRFTLRKSLSPIRSQAGRKRLLWNRDHTPKVSVHLKPSDLESEQTAGLQSTVWLGGKIARCFLACPDWPPRFFFDFFRGGARFTSGPSDDGGFDELEEFWFRRSSRVAMRCSY